MSWPFLRFPDAGHSRTMQTEPDLDWNEFDPNRYLDANYRTVLDADRRICEALAELYGELADAGHRNLRVLDVGTGPNLYPLIAALPVASRIDCGDRSDPNNKYLLEQLHRPAAHWGLFSEVMAERHPAYRDLPWQHLLASRTRPYDVNIYDLPTQVYDVVSSFFVAESITDERGSFRTADDSNEFAFTNAVRSLVGSVAPGGVLVMALMAGSHGYDTAGAAFPATPVDAFDVRSALLAAGCHDPEIIAIDESVRDGHAGMFLAIARVPERAVVDTDERATISIEVLHLDPRQCQPEILAERIATLRRVAHPALLADATRLVMIDDVSLSGRPNRVRKAATAAADAIVTTMTAQGFPVDGLLFESDLDAVADQVVALLPPELLHDGVLHTRPHPKSETLHVRLWTDGEHGRKYSCPMLAATWQMVRLGLTSVEGIRRLSDRPLVAQTSLSALDAEYVHVESEVRGILAALQPPELAAAVSARLGWLLLPTESPVANEVPDSIEPLVPSEGDMWHRIDIGLYVKRNYQTMLPVDEAIATRLATFFDGFDGDFVDVGAGGNLYPSMAGARCNTILAWEYAPGFCTYLEQQYADASPEWDAFVDATNAPSDWRERLASRARVVQGGVLDLPEASFDIATLMFVAECADGNWSGFATSIAATVRALRPGGRLFIACAADSGTATYGDVDIPLLSVDAADLTAALQGAGAIDVEVELLAGDDMRYRENHSGVLIATAVR